jgi:hypothetical protein
MSLVVDFIFLLCISALSSSVVVDLGKKVVSGVGRLKNTLFSNEEGPCCRMKVIFNTRSSDDEQD